VVDLGVAAPATPEAAAAAAAALSAAGGASGIDAITAQAGAGDVPSARAGAIRNPRTTVPQGAMIAAVLETAINSDLPGFVRAVVSRDVRGFDGQAVLIPRGSRLIGQYRSEVALGQSRALVVWTRLIRPDGVSIQLASPGTDTLGRAGLDGEVDRHFLQRYGPGLLTTILSAALTDRSNQVIIGTAQAAGAALQPEAVKPTVTVRQGSAIQVFVARDLDFGSVARGGPGAGVPGASAPAAAPPPQAPPSGAGR
jgi:type IV secretion system protein VirB10